MTKRKLDNLPSEDTVRLLNKKRCQSTVLPTAKPGNSLCVRLFLGPLPTGRVPRGTPEEHPSGIQKAGKWREPPRTQKLPEKGGIFGKPLGQFQQPGSLGRPWEQSLSRARAPGGPQPCQDTNKRLCLANSSQTSTVIKEEEIQICLHVPKPHH